MSPDARQTDNGYVLGIETATFFGSVALVSGGAVRAELLVHNPRSHSERLLPSVETLLGQLGSTAADLTAIAVSMGPGSFTGLRIGVAAAKGLAYSLGVPLFGVPTLEVLAANSSPRPGPVCAVLDARRGEIFTALFAYRKGSLVALQPGRTSSPEDLAGSLERGTLVVGDLPASLLCTLRSPGAPAVEFAPAGQSYPRAATVALRGAAMLAEGRSSQTESLLPLYLRPFDAEAGKAGKGRN